MLLTKRSKLAITIVLTFLMSHLPNVAAAEKLAAQQGEMISTDVVVHNFNRQRTEQDILNYLSKDKAKETLMANGISAEEASARIASLSDQELQDMSKQVEQAKYGGDILVTILIVVLIIFLIKRI